MKRRKTLPTILLVILAALILGAIFCVVRVKNADVCPVENENVAAFTEDVTYEDGDASRIAEYTPETERRDRPAGYTVCFAPTDGRIELHLKGLKGETHPADTRILPADGNAGQVTVTNLYPDTFYLYLVKSADRLLKFGVFRTVGQVRMLEVDGVYNVRDIGGWQTENGPVRYGKIFRGSELSGEHDFKITEEGIKAMREAGTGFEMDLRLDIEVDMDETGEEPVVSSVLGDDVGYERIELVAYLKPWIGDADEASDRNAGEKADAEGISRYYEVMKRIFDCVKREVPVYVHCWGGADRTGTVCLLIEGLLGVSESDLAKDYELTTLAQEFGLRSKDLEPYDEMMTYIKSRDGATLKDKIEGLFLEMGFTSEEIEEFRENMT